MNVQSCPYNEKRELQSELYLTLRIYCTYMNTKVLVYSKIRREAYIYMVAGQYM